MQDFTAIYGQGAQAFVEFSADAVGRLLQQAASVLEDLSRKATRPVERDRYQGDAQALLAARQGLQSAFARRMESKFSAFAGGEELSEKETLEAQPQDLSSEVVRTVDSLTNRVAESLWHLNMRLSLLRGGRKTADYGNPMGPSQFCGALCAVLAQYKVHPRLQMLLFRLVEKSLPERLAAFYEALNQRLAQKGIFPHLRYYLVEAGQDPAKPANQPASVFDRDAIVSAAASERETQSHFSSLIREQSSRREQALRQTLLGTPFDGLDTEGRGGMDTLNDVDIVFAAVALQSRYPVPRGRVHRAVPPIPDLEAMLIDYLRKSGEASGRRRLKRLWAESLLRTGALFSSLLQDPCLCQEVRDLISYLYLPILKLGMIDGRFWTDPAHVGRRLVSLVVELGEFWMASPLNDRTVYPLLHAAVERAVQEFIDDASVLQPVVDDLEAFAVRMGQRAQLTLNRTIEGERGLARMGSAQAFAAEEAHCLMADYGIAESVQGLIEVPLADFLARVVIREGSLDGTGVPDALGMALGAALDVEADRKRQPALLEALNDILSSMTEHAQVVQALVDAVRRAQEVLLADVAVPCAGRKNRAQTAMAANATVSNALGSLPGQGFGSWFAVRQEEGGQPRLWLLIWASPAPRRYLFVNRLGIRGDLLDEARLACLLDQGLFVPLPGHGNAWLRAARALDGIRA